MTVRAGEIIREIVSGSAVPVWGAHGVAHWARVMENGLRLAETTGARTEVVVLFALFHDARRVNESLDPGHGRRGAELAHRLRGALFDLDDRDFALLELACRRHTDGLTEADPTVQTCWDADRLDLGRVGIAPDPGRLCTAAARELLPWADGRARDGHVPTLVIDDWQGWLS